MGVNRHFQASEWTACYKSCVLSYTHGNYKTNDMSTRKLKLGYFYHLILTLVTDRHNRQRFMHHTKELGQNALSSSKKRVTVLKGTLTYLWGAHFVKCNKDKRLDKTCEFYVSTIFEWHDNHQYHLRHEQSQWHGTRHNPHQIQHVEIWWEVVANVTPSYVIPIGIPQKFFTIPVRTTLAVNCKNKPYRNWHMVHETILVAVLLCLLLQYCIQWARL